MGARKPKCTATDVAFVLYIGALGAGAFALWLPQQRAGQRTSNERNAATSLKTLSSAQADFRTNDRDANGVSDFWTGDVTELFRRGLIERGVAEADVNPLVPLVPRPIPFHGYYYRALAMDNSASPPESYQQDTDRKNGKVHHRERFGFVAYPAEPGVTGHYIYIINEFNSYWSCPVEGCSVPVCWPADSESMQWNRCSGG